MTALDHHSEPLDRVLTRLDRAIELLTDIRDTRDRQNEPVLTLADPPKCQAHGDPHCDLCSLNPADCADPHGQCGTYSETGMHWDSCPNRIRSYPEAAKRLRLLEQQQPHE